MSNVTRDVGSGGARKCHGGEVEEKIVRSVVFVSKRSEQGNELVYCNSITKHEIDRCEILKMTPVTLVRYHLRRTTDGNTAVFCEVIRNGSGGNGFGRENFGITHSGT